MVAFALLTVVQVPLLVGVLGDDAGFGFGAGA